MSGDYLITGFGCGTWFFLFNKILFSSFAKGVSTNNVIKDPNIIVIAVTPKKL